MGKRLASDFEGMLEGLGCARLCLLRLGYLRRERAESSFPLTLVRKANISDGTPISEYMSGYRSVTPLIGGRAAQMSKSKLIKGRYLNWNVPGTQNAQAGEPGDFVTHLPKPMKIEMSATVKSMRQSNVVHGTDLNKDWRNFQWLDYYPLRTCWVPLGNTDLLTGRMTGCYVIVYSEDNVVKVAHVGTESTQPKANNTLKEKWNAFCALPNVNVIKGFKPSDHVQMGKTPPKGFSYLFTIGGVTRSQDLFTVVLYGQNAPIAGGVQQWYIQDVVDVGVGLPVNDLTNLKMQDVSD